MSPSGLILPTAFCEDDEPNSPEDCNIPAFMTCTQPLQALEGEIDPNEVCKPWTKGKECLEMLEDACPPGEYRWHVKNALHSLEYGMAHICTNHDVKSCDWEDVRECTGPMEDLAGESDLAKICKTWEDIEDCLEGLDEECEDEGIKNVVWNSLGTIRSNLKGSCHSVEEGCSLQHVQQCSAPMAEFEGKENLHLMLHEICPAMMTVKNCLEDLAPKCGEPYKSPVELTQKSIETNMNMFGCPMEDKKGDETLCTMAELQKCSARLSTMAEDYKDNPYEMCRIWWQSKGCLRDIHMACGPGDVLTAVKDTWHTYVAYMAGCEPYAPCTEDASHECMTRHPIREDGENQCSDAEAAERCLTEQARGCEDQIVLDLINKVSMPLVKDKLNRCTLGADTECKGTKFAECAKPLQDMYTDTGGDKERMCGVWSTGKVCLKTLMDSCPSGHMRSTVETMWQSLQQSMSDCPDSSDGSGPSTGNEQGNQQGPTDVASVQTSTLMHVAISLTITFMFMTWH